MLNFFRKYQKFFFIFTTLLIVLSFVFYGTYQAFDPAMRKKAVTESYLTQMVRFLNTEQWMTSQKFFAANFLNDGVLSKEFLETGMADLIVAHYGEKFQKEFAECLEKEKKYIPYEHPALPTLSALSIWSIFAPELPLKLNAHLEGTGCFKTRNALFLAQKQFPPSFLSQIIRYQEQKNPHLPKDPRLNKEDSGLFNYHELTDWFGTTLIETFAETIIKTAGIARELGFTVTKEEILAELLTRSQEVYQNLSKQIDLPVQDCYGLFKLYLSHTGFTEHDALHIWEDVALFRRLMHSVGDAAIVDPLPLSQFYGYAFENALLEVVQMAPEFRLSSIEELKKFEAYLYAVAEKKGSPLDIPDNYAPITTIFERAPELVGRRFKILFSTTSKKALQSKVSLKETWQWECDEKNWNLIKEQFPDLIQKKGSPFDILENCGAKIRKEIDAFARAQIVANHPEWIHTALLENVIEEKEFFLSPATEKPLDGITDTGQWITALDAHDEIMGYSQDEQHYYRFLVKEKADENQILTFKEAQKAGILEKLVNKIDIQSTIQAVKEATPKLYKEQPFAFRFASFIDKYKKIDPKGELSKQFTIQRKEKTVTRADKSFIDLDACTHEEGALSPVKCDLVEGPYVYRFIEKGTTARYPLDKMIQKQELLSKEARCRYFEKLLTEWNSSEK